MEIWESDYLKGLEFLDREKHIQAVKYLHKAVKACPPDRCNALGEVLFYLGKALKLAGMGNAAERSWDVSYCADKSGMASEIMRSFESERRTEKDRRDFYQVQIKLYIRGKKNGKMDSMAEKDMIRDLISMYWDELNDSGMLLGKCSAEKHLIYRSIEINFPYSHVRTEEFSGNDHRESGRIVPFRTDYHPRNDR